MIGIIDYGLGNIQAIANIYKRQGIDYLFVKNDRDFDRATKLILPGVGAFDWAMKSLNESGMKDVLNERVIQDRIPVLGICVGMQMMATSSSEGDEPGLGWIDANVLEFDDNRSQESVVRRPHMGWNDVAPIATDCIFSGIVNPSFYFLHSFYFQPNRDSESLGKTDYHGFFTSAVKSANVLGVQFHPEKSHGAGVRLLSNFASISC